MDILLRITIGPDTPIKDINLWLESLEQTIDTLNTRIFSKVVSYKNVKNKSNQIATTSQAMDYNDWEQCATLEDLATKLKGSGNRTMAWMCNNISDVVKEDTEAEYLKTKVLGQSY